MSLDLSVLMKDRLTKERLASLHAFLTKEGFLKEKIGTSSFFYFSTKPNISIDIYLTKAPMKGDDFWKNMYKNGKRVHFPPKSEITMESRSTEASHLKAYALGMALAACRSYRCWPAFTSEEIFLLAHNSGLIVNPKGS